MRYLEETFVARQDHSVSHFTLEIRAAYRMRKGTSCKINRDSETLICAIADPKEGTRQKIECRRISRQAVNVGAAILFVMEGSFNQSAEHLDLGKDTRPSILRKHETRSDRFSSCETVMVISTERKRQDVDLFEQTMRAQSKSTVVW